MHIFPARLVVARVLGFALPRVSPTAELVGHLDPEGLGQFTMAITVCLCVCCFVILLLLLYI